MARALVHISSPPATKGKAAGPAPMTHLTSERNAPASARGVAGGAWDATRTSCTLPSMFNQMQLPPAASQAHLGRMLSWSKTACAMAQESAEPMKMQAIVSTRPFVKKSRKRSA